MRKIERRGVEPPRHLLSRSVRDALSAVRSHYALAQDIRDNKRAPIDLELLANPELEIALRTLFNGACSYCESQIPEQNRGLDHFRPIASAGDGHDKTSSDHYGWFAYEWRNLLLICPNCQRAKRNLFPVENPRAPILCSWTEAGQSEGHLLLDPCIDEPLRHLSVAPDGMLVAHTLRGHTTIEVIDLNRPDLLDARSQVVADVFAAFEAYLAAKGSKVSINPIELAGVARSGALLLCLKGICRFLPASYSNRGTASTAAFRRHFSVLLETLETEVWQAALVRYRTADAATLGSDEDTGQEARLNAREIGYGRAASARVARISIRNFKGIQQLDLDLDSSSESRQSAGSVMLLGENSTGKSSVLQAICLALSSPSQRRRWRLDPEDFISREKSGWQLVGEYPGEIVVGLDNQRSIELTVNSDTFEGGGEPAILLLAYGAHRLFGERDTGGRPSIPSRTLFHSLSVIPDSTQWLREASDLEFSAVARALDGILALKLDDHIHRDADGNIQVQAHGRTTPIERMSDGYKSLFSMAVDVMRQMVERWGNLEEARGIVLIDEVETHLHPRWKMQVMGALRRSMPQVQFIVTTHDPLCLRGMRDGEVQVLVRNEENVVEVLRDLPSVQGLRAEQLLTSDYFGLASTTDPQLETLLQQYAKFASEPNAGMDDTRKALLDRLAQQISQITALGNDAGQQLVTEAVAQYLATRTVAPLRAGVARREAVLAVLDVLDPK